MELTTNPDKPADDDFAKILILDAFEFAKEKWRTGLTAPVVVEMLIGRKLTEEEEDYVFLHTEPPTSRLKPRARRGLEQGRWRGPNGGRNQAAAKHPRR